MWHGTTTGAGELIVRDGFDTRHCQRGGPGIYMAEEPGTSLHYCWDKKNEGHAVLLLNRVCIGGSPTIVFPTSESYKFHAATTKLTHFGVLALGDVERIYPAYVVRITWQSKIFGRL